MEHSNLCAYDLAGGRFTPVTSIRIEYAQETPTNSLILEINQKSNPSNTTFTESTICNIRTDSNTFPLLAGEKQIIKVNFCYKVISIDKDEFLAMVQPKHKSGGIFSKYKLSGSGNRKCRYL